MKIFTVRNNDSFCGTYAARDAKHAIQRFNDEQQANAATFRRSQMLLKFSNLTAAVEPRSGI